MDRKVINKIKRSTAIDIIKINHATAIDIIVPVFTACNDLISLRTLSTSGIPNLQAVSSHHNELVTKFSLQY